MNYFDIDLAQLTDIRKIALPLSLLIVLPIMSRTIRAPLKRKIRRFVTRSKFPYVWEYGPMALAFSLDCLILFKITYITNKTLQILALCYFVLETGFVLVWYMAARQIRLELQSDQSNQAQD